MKRGRQHTKTKYEYEAYIKDRVISRSMLETAKFEGMEQGILVTQKGVIHQLQKEGFDMNLISRIML